MSDRPLSDLQLDDLLVWYPDQDAEKFQTWITGMEEFSSLASDPKEPIPKRGDPFKHQELIARFMLAYDYLYAMHRTGTGKTCGGGQAAEKLKNNSAYDLDMVGTAMSEEENLDNIRNTLDLSNLLLKNPKSNIIKVLIIVKGRTLQEQFKQEIICKCTAGQYETEQIKNAKKVKSQRNNATRSLQPYYEITRYGTFANSLIPLNDEQIREKYSDTLVIFDEIQTLRNNIKVDPVKEKDEEAEFKTKYKQLRRMLYAAKRTKVLILSATPMVNEPKELAMIMNLLYPQEIRPDGEFVNRMDIGVDYSSDEWNLEKIEPYLRGRISYVRELDTGAIPEYVGTQIPGYYEILALAPMSTHQADAYRKASSSTKNNWFSIPRQAAIFVFPDGGTTKETLKKYIQATPKLLPEKRDKRTNRVISESRKETENEAQERVVKGDGPYYPTPELEEYIKHRDLVNGKNLSVLSRKYQNIIDECTSAVDKNCFIFTDFVTGPGSITLGMCLEAQGYERFMQPTSVFVQEQPDNKLSPDLSDSDNSDSDLSLSGSSMYDSDSDDDDDGEDGFASSYCEPEDRSSLQVRSDFVEKPRYALITGNTNPERIQNILKTYNSYHNRHGRLIKILVGSVKIREGLNLSNVQVIHLTGGGWNQAATYQAISRGIRSSSHVDLINELQDIIMGPSLTLIIKAVNIIYLIHKDRNNMAKLDIDTLKVLDKQSNTTIRPLIELINITRDKYGEMIASTSNLEKNKLRENIKNNMRQLVRNINEYILSLEAISFQNKNSDDLMMAWKGWNHNRDAVILNFSSILSLFEQLLVSLSKNNTINENLKSSVNLINNRLSLLSNPAPPMAVKANLLKNLITDVGKSYQLDGSVVDHYINMADGETFTNEIPTVLLDFLLDSIDIKRVIEEYLRNMTRAQIQENLGLYTNMMIIVEGYQSPDNATISIAVHKNASVYNILNDAGNLDIEDNGKMGKALNTVDITFYTGSEDKDRKNRKVERYMKQAAVDGPTHKRRNIRDEQDMNGGPVCDYQNCDYEFTDPPPISVYRYRGGQTPWQKIFARGYKDDDGSVYVHNGFTWDQLTLENANISILTDRQFPNFYEASTWEEVNESGNYYLNGDLLMGSGKLAIDSANYDNMYAQPKISETTTDVISVLQENSRMTYQELFSVIDSKPRYTLQSLITIIDNKKPIRNRYGVINYVNEEKGSIFVQPEYPTNPFYLENQVGLGYYSKHFHGIESKSLEDILNQENADSQRNIFDKFTNMPKDDKFYQSLANLTPSSRASLLEQAFEKLVAGENSETVVAILNKFNNLFYFIQEPVEAQQKVQLIESQRGVTGRGRRPKADKPIEVKLLPKEFDPSTNLNWIKYFSYAGVDHYLTTTTDANGNIATLYKDKNTKTGEVSENTQESIGSISIIHIIHTMTQAKTKAHTMTRLLRANGTLRIYSMVAKKWRTVQNSELLTYSAITQLEITKKFDPYNNIPVYGVYTFDNVFRLVRGNPGDNIHQSAIRICNQMTNSDIAESIASLHLTPNEIDNEFEPLSQSELNSLDSYLSAELPPDISLSDLTPEDKHIYYRVLQGHIKVGDLCIKLQRLLHSRGYEIHF